LFKVAHLLFDDEHGIELNGLDFIKPDCDAQFDCRAQMDCLTQ